MRRPKPPERGERRVRLLSAECPRFSSLSPGVGGGIIRDAEGRMPSLGGFGKCVHHTVKHHDREANPLRKEKMRKITSYNLFKVQI